MKVFEFAGIIFNVENVCTIQKVNIRKSEKDETIVPGIQIVTIAGGVSFTFETEKERDEKFAALKEELKKL